MRVSMTVHFLSQYAVLIMMSFESHTVTEYFNFIKLDTFDKDWYRSKGEDIK